MLEAELQSRLLKRLRALGGHWDNLHGGAYQRPGIPDIIGCYKGRYVSIEVKRPHKYSDPKQGMTPTQWNHYSQILANGGLALVVDSVEPVFDALNKIED